MKIYIVVRWGNPYEEDKCDGRDTFFFVAARNHLNASRRVTRYLKETEPECSEMKYQYLCNQILELGEYTADSAKEYILTGPFYEYFAVNERLFQQCWVRDTFWGTSFSLRWQAPKTHISQRERAYFIVVRFGNFEGNFDLFSTTHACSKGDAMFIIIAKNNNEAVKISRKYPLKNLDSKPDSCNFELVLRLCSCHSYSYKCAEIIGVPYISKFHINGKIVTDIKKLENQ